ncbi:hypothetical protein TRVL_02987 [Trypanosoma vivax]|nr:hypothetical protein TRVL_02987 [Trypanosoma vivax]
MPRQCYHTLCGGICTTAIPAPFHDIGRHVRFHLPRPRRQPPAAHKNPATARSDRIALFETQFTRRSKAGTVNCRCEAGTRPVGPLSTLSVLGPRKRARRNEASGLGSSAQHCSSVQCEPSALPVSRACI